MSKTDYVSETYWQAREQIGESKYHYLVRTKIFEQRPVTIKQMGNYFGNLDKPAMLKSIRRSVKQKIEGMPKQRRVVARRYPGVRVREQLLVRACWEALFELKSKRSSVGLISLERLIKNTQDFVLLSTYAVNTSILEREDGISLNMPSDIELRNIWRQIPWTEEQMQDKIYFLTHMIIANSRFYTSAINETFKNLIRQEMEETEKIIKAEFGQLTVDVKLEFLLCQKMLLMKSKLRRKILQEAERGIGGRGYIYDPRKRDELASSEHRSMLYLGVKKWQMPAQW